MAATSARDRGYGHLMAIQCCPFQAPAAHGTRQCRNPWACRLQTRVQQ